MSTQQNRPEVAQFDVKNIGGITQTSIDIPPGVTVLSGENATNRTSFLQAIMAATGSDNVSLKADADIGEVTLQIGNEKYHRTIKRTDDGISFDRTGYLEDPEVADLFAFLLETNDARQTVALDGNLRDVIMRPIDVESLQAEIERLETAKGEINEELATIESRKGELPDLEQRRTEIEAEIESKREDLAELENEIDDHSREVEESRQEQEAFEAKLDELRSTRSDLEATRRNIENQQDSIASLKQERSDLKAELEDLPSEPPEEQSQIETELERLRSQRQTLNAEISELQSLIEYNEERLQEEDYQILDDLDENTGEGTPTDELLAETDEVVCWTCGTTVERQQIEGTIDRLRTLRNEKVTKLNGLKGDIEDLKEQKRNVERQQERRTEVQQQLTTVEDELDRRREQLESLQDRRQELTDDIETLENEIEELESEDFEDVLSLHKRANSLEFDIEQLESELDGITDKIETIEGMIEDGDELREEREQLVDELTDKRTKIDQIEQNAIDQFNEHMGTILDLLNYENLDRIWIEQVEQTVREGRQTVHQPAFELHVVRSTENGTAYEDTISHLSESEREVTGLVFALAGYLVHDLHETVPFMLLDSLEAIDSDRIASLITYLADFVDYLIVALLEEDAEALSEEYYYVTDI